MRELELNERLRLPVAVESPAAPRNGHGTRPPVGFEVSVIIPAYNAAETLADALDSLIAQSHAAWEAIVVDDGSTDHTAQVANRYAVSDNRIRLVQRTNGGEGTARNTGITESHYEWLLFLDSDDWIAPTHLERLVCELASDASLDAVHCGHARVTLDGTRIPERYLPPSGDLFHTLARRAAFPVHACLVRRSLVEAVGGFDTSLRKSPDWDLWQRIARTGARFGAVREVLAYYRMQPNSASLDARQMLCDGLRVLRQGHAPDPRVRNPHPLHVRGLPREQLEDQQYYLLSWCAGLQIGRGEDPRPLLELIERHESRNLYPDAIAQCIFDSAPLATCRSCRAWDELWPRHANLIEELFAALEVHAKVANLSDRANVRFKQLLLANSPVWRGVIEDFQQHQVVLTDDRDNWRRLAEHRAETLSVADESINQLQRTHLALQDEKANWQSLANERQVTANTLATSLQSLAEISRRLENERDTWQQLAEERQAEAEMQAAAVRRSESDQHGIEEQRAFWQQLAEERQAEAETQAAAVRRLESELHQSEEKRASWRQLAEERQAEATTQTAAVRRLETDLHGIEEQRANWQRLAATTAEERSHWQQLAEEQRVEIENFRASVQCLELGRTVLQQQVAALESVGQRLRQQLGSLTAERNALQFSPEREMGELLLNQLRFKRPILALAAGTRAVGHRVQTARLALERRWPRRPRQLRVLATICTEFPIYSQTFVHQELTQLVRQGFDVRIVYSKRNARSHLSTQFSRLWRLKRRLHLNRGIHERDFVHYKTRLPEKVQALVERVCQASGLSREALLHHDNFLQAFSFTRLAEAYRPDYIHSYFFYDRSLMALVAGWLLDIPRGVSCYADHVLQDYELKVVPLHLELCDIVVATSQRIRDELVAIAPQADAARILVKPNGIDTECFPVMERAEPQPGAPFRIVTVCRIEPKKGLLDLVEAVHLLRQRGVAVEAHVVGTTDDWSEASRNYKQQLDQKITELNLWGIVHLEGQQNLEGIRRFLGMAHLFVAPFVETESGDKDGIPTALLEAMATGLPAVATNAGSIPEVITCGEEGRLVPQRSPAALADQIEALFRDPNSRHHFADSAAAKVRCDYNAATCDALLHSRINDAVQRRTTSRAP